MAALTPPPCSSRAPNGVGAVLPAAVAVVPGACDLKGIVKTLSFLGPIVAFLLIVVGYSATTGSHGIEVGAAAIGLGARDIAQIGGAVRLR